VGGDCKSNALFSGKSIGKGGCLHLICLKNGCCGKPGQEGAGGPDLELMMKGD